jgi:hypothetical protein
MMEWKLINVDEVKLATNPKKLQSIRILIASEFEAGSIFLVNYLSQHSGTYLVRDPLGKTSTIPPYIDFPGDPLAYNDPLMVPHL